MTDKPVPVIDRDNEPYWEAARRGELRFQRCRECGVFRHYPLPACPACHSFEDEWIRSEGRGRVFTWTVAHHAVHPAFTDVPYVIAVVEMNDCGQPHVICNLDAPPAEIEADMDVEIYFEQRGDYAIPQARPVANRNHP